MITASPILQSVSVRAICPNGFVWSYRTRAPVGLKTEKLETPTSRASTVFASATYIPTPWTGSGNCRTVERNTPVAPVRLLFLFKLVAGRTRDIMRPAFPTLRTVWSGKFWPAPAFTAGKCFSFLYSLLKPRKQSGSIITILFRPFHSAEPLCLGLIARSDGHRVAKGNGHVRHETGQF